MPSDTFRILVVEDEAVLAEIARDYLIAAGMEADVLTDGTHAAEVLLENNHDLAILDLMLPGKDGLSVCRDVRRKSDVPIIMATAKVEEIDRLLGLELGADDYLCKPYSPRELVARVKAVLRRSASRQTTDATAVDSDRLMVDPDRWQASIGGQTLDLTRREFQLLSAMATRPGRIFSRAQLLDLAFPDDTDVVDRTVDSHMKNIRRKITAVTDREPIRSVYGVGYGFEE